MEQNRNPLPAEEINALMEKYRSYKKFNKEQLDLIREDLEYGLTPEEIESYTNKKDYKKMKVISKCLRANFLKEVIEFIGGSGMNVEQMEAFYDAHMEGASFEVLKDIKVLVGNSSHQIKTAIKLIQKQVENEIEKRNAELNNTESVETQEKDEAPKEESQTVDDKLHEEPSKSDTEKQEYSSRLVSDIKELIKKELQTVKEDEAVRQRLVNQIAEKDSDLSAKQDELNNAIGKVQTLSKENEELKNEMELLKKELEERKEKALKASDEKVSDNNKGVLEKTTESVIAESVPEESKAEVGERDVNKMDEKMINRNPIGVKGIGVAVPVYYQIPIVDSYGRKVMDVTVGKDERKTSGIFSVMSKLLFKKKSRADIVKLVASGDLVPAQLIQIKNAIERGLTEGQLVELINNNLTPDKMKEIIEIAVLENSILC